MQNNLTISSSDNLNLYIQHQEATTPKATIVLVHGMYEHSGRYEHVVAAANARGYNMVAYDLRGHGKSDGQRGHTPSYERLMIDLDFVLRKAKELYPHLPIILYGHSFGGNQVLNYIIRRKHDILCTVATGPWIRLAFEPPRFKVALAKMMHNFFPAYTEKANIDTTAISRDIEEVKKYTSDPLVHDMISARMYLQAFEAGNYIMERYDLFTIPVLLMHGDQDKLTSHQASIDLSQMKKSQFTMRIWNGLFHEIHNEPEQKEVIQFMLDWLDRQIS